ncbi:hypothetical protein PAXINDRAFT_14143 [Paxillus involutus ATCC 200175]|uniref:Uncharacterized protein n=1 Tax=Paxillus involutus ATCC 200175 TaxID=664439 RepID=A0A0C9TZW3_PAXIN|nr:hypothetical protein PAXINDRAFT_14143 [Paxillus involutus ATCC 200175]
MTPSPPSPTARPSRHAKTAHKFIKPTRERKRTKQHVKKIVIPPHNRTKSPTPQHGPSSEETSRAHSLDREQEYEGRAHEVDHQSTGNQASAVKDTHPDLFERDTSDRGAEVDATASSDEEVPRLAEGVDQSDENDEGQHPRSSASVAKVKSAHRPGPLPDEACRKAHELGDSVMKALQELAVQYGKPVQRILEEAGLNKLATRGEQQWNLHQKWYAICHPITDNESVKEYRLRQKEHYVTHSDEEDHAALWQDIREHGNAIVHEGELSAKSLAALIEEAREQFAKGASAWSRLEGVEVIGMVVYKGHDSVARHAAGWFGGSTFVRELINSHELQLAKWLDYVTTVIKYKEIDPSVSVPILDFDIDANVEDQVSNTNQELERGATEGFRDWNRRIVPAMMGKKLKPFGCTDGKNIPWQSFDDLLYRHKLTVTNWPAGVAVPPTWVPHDATVDELISVVGPFLKRHLPSLYSRHIVPNAGRRRSSKGKNKQPRLPIPEVEISVVAWIPEWCHWLEHNDSRMFTIPLVMDTESQPLCILRQCRKFLRDVPRDISISPEPESEQCSSPSSPSSHGPSPVMPPKRAKGIVKQHHRTHLGPLPVPFSKANLPPRKRHCDEEESLEEHLGRKHMKPESRVRAARTQQAHQQLQPDTSEAEMLHYELSALLVFIMQQLAPVIFVKPGFLRASVVQLGISRMFLWSVATMNPHAISLWPDPPPCRQCIVHVHLHIIEEPVCFAILLLLQARLVSNILR